MSQVQLVRSKQYSTALCILRGCWEHSFSQVWEDSLLVGCSLLSLAASLKVSKSWLQNLLRHSLVGNLRVCDTFCLKSFPCKSDFRWLKCLIIVLNCGLVFWVLRPFMWGLQLLVPRTLLLIISSGVRILLGEWWRRLITCSSPMRTTEGTGSWRRLERLVLPRQLWMKKAKKSTLIYLSIWARRLGTWTARIRV